MAVAADEPIFVDVSSRSGLDFVHGNGMTGELYFPEMTGQGGAFLDYDLGAGFHPDLTGRENISISGVISGLRYRQVSSRRTGRSTEPPNSTCRVPTRT